MKKTYEEILRIIIARQGKRDIKLEDISSDRDFMNDLGFTSIDSISLIVEIEKEFNVEIPDDYLLLTNINTLDKLCKMLNELLKTTI